MSRARYALFLTVVVPMWSVSLHAATAPHISIALDASDAPRKIFHAQLTIPAVPGTLTLYYPKWIPGEHAPSGPVINLAGLKFMGNNQLLKWRRALDDNWTILVEVPAAVQEVEATLDFLSPAGADQALFSAAASRSAHGQRNPHSSLARDSTGPAGAGREAHRDRRRCLGDR